MKDDELGEYEADLPCTPTKDKLRYIDDNDLISSDDSISSIKPKKYNQLTPKANYIYKLLQSSKPKSDEIWRDAAVPDGIELINIDNFNLDLYSISPQKMAKTSKKRKRKEDSLEEEERPRKRKHAKSSHTVLKCLDTKVNHDISPSDSECSLETPSREIHTKLINEKNDSSGLVSQSEYDSSSEQTRTLHANKSSELLTNGHSDSEGTSFGADVDSDHESERSISKNRSFGINIVKGLNDKSSDTGSIKEKFYEPNFTEKDREDISKYSFLLSDKLSEENNIWILHCPSNMDCSGLENQYLDLGSSCQLNIGHHSFEAYSYRDNGSRYATLAVPSRDNHLQLCTIPITGDIVVEESLSCENETSSLVSEPSQGVNFPENLKTRHPLLGTDYENQPRTMPNIEQIQKKKKKHSHKLVNNEDDVESEITSRNAEHSKKKKKHHKSREDVDITVPEMESNTSGSMEYVKKKKKKKHKISEITESNLTEISVELCSPVKPHEDNVLKRKKKKKHLDDTSF